MLSKVVYVNYVNLTKRYVTILAGRRATFDTLENNRQQK